MAWSDEARQAAQKARPVEIPMVPVLEMRGQLTTPEALLRFLLAGRALITVRSKASGTRFTFKFSRPKEDPAVKASRRPIWVSVLTGQNNEGDYTYLGAIWQDAEKFAYRHSSTGSISITADSVCAVQWMVKLLNLSPENLLRQAEVWHEGRCGRCGRTLTVPSSIESGFGPECITMI